MNKNIIANWLCNNAPYFIKIIAKVALSPCYHLKILLNDLKALLGITSFPTNIIFVAGYPKSGTTWVENFISNVPGYSPRVLGGDAEILRLHGIPADAFKRIPKYAYSAIKTHATPHKDNIDILIENGVTKVLVMWRDPRDIIISNYYHVLNENPWKSDDSFYADYTKMSKEDAISHSMELIIEDFCYWVRGWLDVPDLHEGMQCHFVTYEELRRDHVLVFRNILNFFGIVIDETRFLTAMRASQTIPASTPSGREPGLRSTMRKGVIGGWREELNDYQKQYIKEHAGQYLVELGFEQNSEW